MHVLEAADRIAEIHAQLAKSEIYRGYRPLPVAATGVVGLLAGLLQQQLLVTAPTDFVAYWVAIAVVCACVGFGSAFLHAWLQDDAGQHRRTVQVVGQFAPCLAAGAVVTAALVRVQPDAIVLLPGLWTLLFGLGVFASRPYLPRTIGWGALFYLAAGWFLLLAAHRGFVFLGLGLGAAFAAGQFFTAYVLFRNIPRDCHEC